MRRNFIATAVTALVFAVFIAFFFYVFSAKNELKKSVDDAVLNGEISRIVDEMPLERSQKLIIRDFYLKLLSFECLDDALDALLEKNKIEKSFDSHNLVQHILGYILKTADNQLLQLEPKHRQAVFRMYEKYSFVLPPDLCRLFVSESYSLEDYGRIMEYKYKAYRHMSDNELYKYTDALYHAALLQCKSHRQYSFDNDDKVKASNIIFKGMQKYLMDKPDVLKLRIFSTFHHMKTSSDMDVCTYGQHLYQAVLQIASPYDRDQAIKLLLTKRSNLYKVK